MWGLALSPDGTKLAVADIQAALIYVLDPTNPSSVKSYPFVSGYTTDVSADPAGVAITNAGVVYITAYIQGGSGYATFFKLDTATSKVTNLNFQGTNGPGDNYLRTLISADGTRVFLDADGGIFSLDTSSGALFQPATEVGCCYGNDDMALSQNQIQFSASGYFYDSDLNPASFEVLNDRDLNAAVISYVYGTKLSPDGSLLFQPSQNGMDIFDGRLGTLVNRVAFGFSLSSMYDSLVEDGRDNVLVAITGDSGTGVAILDFSSVNEPLPLPYSVAESNRQSAKTAHLHTEDHANGESHRAEELVVSAPYSSHHPPASAAHIATVVGWASAPLIALAVAGYTFWCPIGRFPIRRAVSELALSHFFVPSGMLSRCATSPRMVEALRCELTGRRRAVPPCIKGAAWTGPQARHACATKVSGEC